MPSSATSHVQQRLKEFQRTAYQGLNGLSTEWEPEWIVPQIVMSQGLNLLVGSAKAGKSRFRRWCISCAAAGVSPFPQVMSLGKRLENVLLLLGEEIPDAEATFLYRTWRYLHSEEPWEQFRTRFTILPKKPFLQLDNLHDLEALGKFVEEYGFDLLVVDPLINYHASPENDNVAIVQKVMRPLDVFSEAVEVPVWLTHHTGKTQFTALGGRRKQIGVDASRGASAIAGYCTTITTVISQGKEDKEVHFEPKYAEPAPSMSLRVDAQGAWEYQEKAEVGPEAILEWLMANPSKSKNAIYKAVGGQKARVLRLVDEMVSQGALLVDAEGRFSAP